MEIKERDEVGDEAANTAMDKIDEMMTIMITQASIFAGADEEGKMDIEALYHSFTGIALEVSAKLAIDISDMLTLIRDEFAIRDEKGLIVDFQKMSLDEFLKKLKDK